MKQKRGAIVVGPYIIPWFFLIAILTIVFFGLFVVLTGKSQAALDFMENIFRFGR